MSRSAKSREFALAINLFKARSRNVRKAGTTSLDTVIILWICSVYTITSLAPYSICTSTAVGREGVFRRTTGIAGYITWIFSSIILELNETNLVF